MLVYSALALQQRHSAHPASGFLARERMLRTGLIKRRCQSAAASRQAVQQLIKARRRHARRLALVAFAHLCDSWTRAQVLEVGYDLCTRPSRMARAVDEHYEKIWLSYVVGRKR